jgi:hypothetical protein
LGDGADLELFVFGYLEASDCGSSIQFTVAAGELAGEFAAELAIELAIELAAELAELAELKEPSKEPRKEPSERPNLRLRTPLSKISHNPNPKKTNNQAPKLFLTKRPSRIHQKWRGSV